MTRDEQLRRLNARRHELLDIEDIHGTLDEDQCAELQRTNDEIDALNAEYAAKERRRHELWMQRAGALLAKLTRNVQS